MRFVVASLNFFNFLIRISSRELLSIKQQLRTLPCSRLAHQVLEIYEIKTRSAVRHCCRKGLTAARMVICLSDKKGVDYEVYKFSIVINISFGFICLFFCLSRQRFLKVIACSDAVSTRNHGSVHF